MESWDIAGFTLPHTKTFGIFGHLRTFRQVLRIFLHNQVMEWLPARDSVQMWMIFVQYVKLNFRSQFFSSVSMYFVKSALPYGLTERKHVHSAEL